MNLILLLVAVTIPFAHHLGAVISLLYLLCFVGGLYTSGIPSEKLAIHSLLIPSFLLGVVLLAWYTEPGQDVILLAASAVEPLSPSGATSVPTVPQSSLFTTVRSWAPPLYLAATAALLSFRTIRSLLSNSLDPETVGTYLFSVFVGAITAAAWLTKILNYRRVATYFILAGAAIALTPVTRIRQYRNPILVGLLIILVVLGALMFTTHTVVDIGDEQVVSDQWFPQTDYAAASFADARLETRRAFGDANTREIVAATAGIPVGTRFDAIEQGRIPPDSAVILTDRNREMYFGPTDNGWGKIQAEGLHPIYNTKHNRMYANGGASIWLNSSK
jgi:hypothetical protein